ncbi:MAG: hypothetical protein WC460_03160 [Patescibacteria group bacterium]
MEGKKKKAGIEGVPLLIELENPKNIVGIQAVRMENKKAADKTKELIKEDYRPEKTLVLLGMSTKFRQTNFHKIVTIFVKRG